MFHSIGRLFGLITLVIDAVCDLAQAGKYQTEVIERSSFADAGRKMTQLNTDLELFKSEQAARLTKLKPAA